MKNTILALLVALVALPAFGAISVTGADESATRRVTVSSATGDSGDSAVIKNTCASWRGSFTGAGSHTIYALTDSSAAASSGTLLATFSSTSASVTSFETSWPFLKVAAVGQGQTFLYCAREAGGGGSTFGMSGNTATERTLSAMYQLTEFQDVSALRRRLWFDSYLGNDSNDGSRGAPFRTLGKAEEQCGRYARCTFVSGRVWSPLTLNMATTVNYIAGEAATWDGGASTGTILDWHGPSETLVLERATGTDPTAADTVIGVVSGASTTVDSVTDTIGSAVDDITPSCAANDELCTLLEASVPTIPARINCNGTRPGGATTGILRALGVSASGWVGIQNFDIEFCDEDAIDTANQARMVALNVRVSRTQNVAAANNNCFTSHDTSTMIALNGECRASDNPSGASAQPIAPTNTSNFLLVSRGRYEVGGAGSAQVASLNALRMVVIGPSLVSLSGTRDIVDVIEQSNAIAKVARIARVTASGGSNSCLRFRASAAASTLTSAIHQLTCANTLDGVELALDSPVVNDGWNVFIRGLLMDGLTGDFFYSDAQSDIDRAVIDISNVVHDDDSIVGDWRIVSTSHNTLALAAADAIVTAEAWPNFFTSAQDTTGTTVQAWQNTAGTVTYPDFACHPEQVCYGAYTSTYTITLPSELYVPNFVLGREVRSFRLNESGSKNIGAR